MAATSAFTEGASVFGGQANLVQAIDNIFSVYNPAVIAVHTTCLSETIGDDIPQIFAKAKADGKVPEGKFVFHANTPSYVGSHVTGFASMTKAMVDYFAEADGTAKEKTINLIPGYVEPSDMAEIRRMAEAMGVSTIMFPDTAKVLNGPLTGKYKMFPEGGVTIDALKQSGSSMGTIALGRLASMPAARALDAKCKVPCEILDLPLGLHGTDAFIDTLRRMAGVTVPDVLNLERGQLVDCISDWHQYLYGKRVAVVGDPDQVLALTRFLVSLDMRPVHIVTGSPAGKKLPKVPSRSRGRSARAGEHQGPRGHAPLSPVAEKRPGRSDRRQHLRQVHRQGRGHSPGAPRLSHLTTGWATAIFPPWGYRGALRFLEKLLDAILDRKDRDADDITMELVM